MKAINMILSPDKISSLLKIQKFSAVEDTLIEFIVFNAQPQNTLSLGKPLSENISTIVDPSESLIIEKLCDRYAAVFSELFCDPKYAPSDKMLGTILRFKNAVDWLFNVSPWKTTDSIIEHLGLISVDELGQMKLDPTPNKITLLLALICLGSKYRLPWGALFNASPAITLSSYIGLITQKIPALSEANNKGFNYLLESAKDIPIFELPVQSDLGKLSYVYFVCSYATSPNKYEFKKWLTSLIRHNLPQWLNQNVKEYIANIKPLKPKKNLKVAVVLELYSMGHAMHRVYHAMLESLAKKYELVAFCDVKKTENSSLDIFANVIVLNNSININESAELITKEKPDIILYPSIGMKLWGICLSQLRLAPLQVMMGGHPSSSFSPEIDYFLIPGHSFSTSELQAFVNEPIVTSDKPYKQSQALIRQHSLTTDFLAENDHYIENDTEIRIAINGVITKVTYRLINICKQLQLQSSKKITFIFFTGYQQNQLPYLAIRKQLSRDLEHFSLSCYSNYISYMKTISTCHFLLPTLPFGGANSNVDAMVLKKPKLYIRGNSHIYTRTDQWNWERIDLDNELGCDSEDELIRKSLQLIEDSTYRHDLYIKMTVKCQADNVFSTDNTAADLISPLFDKVIKQVVDNHDDIIKISPTAPRL
jgi:hypothetical protein